MEPLDLIYLVVRRWKLALPLALCCLLAGGIVYQSQDPTYESSGTVLLFRPAVADTASYSQNPWLQFGGLEIPAITVASLMTEPVLAETLIGDDDFAYTVTADTSRGPSLIINVTADTPEATVIGTNRVLAEIKVQLQDQQLRLSAPPETLITAETIRAPNEVVVVNGPRLQAFILVTGFTGVLSLGAVIITDRVIRRRNPEDDEFDDDLEPDDELPDEVVGLAPRRNRWSRDRGASGPAAGTDGEEEDEDHDSGASDEGSLREILN